MAQPAIATAYRQLYRAGLKAVRYSIPQRHVLRWNLRSAFTSGSPADFDSNKIAQTVLFLERAAASSVSMEHKIVKNLLHVRFWEQAAYKPSSKPSNDAAQRYLRLSANAHFNSTLMLLNESLGTCLR